MRFLLHPLRRSVQSSSSVAGKQRADPDASMTRSVSPQIASSLPPSSTVMSSKASVSKPETPNPVSESRKSIIGKNTNNLTNSWGQQCSTDCGCVLRFETIVNQDTLQIVSAKYVAKTVLATVDKETGRLDPVYTTRTGRPMLKECTCPSLHILAKQVTSYLPFKRLDQIRNMNQFTFTRSSPAFRHAVLAEHNLPRSNTHCFDVLEEAFCGVIDGRVPTRRRLDAEYTKLLTAECLQKPLVVYCQQTKQHQHSEHLGGRRETRSSIYANTRTGNGSLGIDKNKLSMTTPRTSSTLRMFDINAEYWDEEEYIEKAAARHKSNGNRFDWVSYIDEMYENEESA